MLYQYKCKKCGEVTEAWRTVKKRKHAPKCEKCGGKTSIMYSAGTVPLANTGKGSRMGSLNTTLDEYPIYVKNKHHFKELCRERGVRPSGLIW